VPDYGVPDYGVPRRGAARGAHRLAGYARHAECGHLDRRLRRGRDSLPVPCRPGVHGWPRAHPRTSPGTGSWTRS